MADNILGFKFPKNGLL